MAIFVFMKCPSSINVVLRRKKGRQRHRLEPKPEPSHGILTTLSGKFGSDGRELLVFSTTTSREKIPLKAGAPIIVPIGHSDFSL